MNKFKQLILIFALCFALSEALVLMKPNEVSTQSNDDVYVYCELAKCKRTAQNITVPLASLENPATTQESLLDLNIFIFGDHDAIITFSEREDDDPSGQIYEIAIGANNNSKIIFESNRNQTLSESESNDVLLPRFPKKFNIKLGYAGYWTIVSTPGVNMPVDAYFLRPMNINFVRFGSRNNASVEFFYDCPQSMRHKTQIENVESNRISSTATVHIGKITFDRYIVCVLISALIKAFHH